MSTSFAAALRTLAADDPDAPGSTDEVGTVTRADLDATSPARRGRRGEEDVVKRLMTGVLILGSAALGFIPIAASAEQISMRATTDGWYQPDPSCAQPSGCLLSSVPSQVSGQLVTNPYPAGTLHVGWASGAETARSVLAFPLDNVDGSLSDATLEVPLDTDAANGDVQSATAKVQICLVTGEIKAASGSVELPPAISCEQHAAMTYSATPSPHLTASLSPLLGGLRTASGIALLPDATEDNTAAWHVTFSAHDRTGSTIAPPALSVTTEDSSSEQPTLPPVAETPAVPVDSGFALAPSTGSGFASVPGVQAPSVEVPSVGTPVTSTPQLVPSTVPTAQTVTIGYQYPVVWLLPLAFLVVLPLTARALTTELCPR